MPEKNVMKAGLGHDQIESFLRQFHKIQVADFICKRQLSSFAISRAVAMASSEISIP